MVICEASRSTAGAIRSSSEINGAIMAIEEEEEEAVEAPLGPAVNAAEVEEYRRRATS
jgi:hypothetical protein